MDRREKIERLAQTPEDRVLLAKVYERIEAGRQREILTNTGFLSQREQALARQLLGEIPGLCFFGGYDGAERRIACYVPEYLDEESLLEPDGPVACIQGTYYAQDTVTHRDLLGALMGAGIARQTVGDILTQPGRCVFFVTAEIGPYVLQNLTSAGRTALHLEQTDLRDVQLPQAETKLLRDTLASLRLDSLVSAGFRIGRSLAAQHILAGRAAVDGIPCEKPDKAVAQGCVVTVRGLGKLRLKEVCGETKKGRVAVLIEKYI